jgi:hypothetical protein
VHQSDLWIPLCQIIATTIAAVLAAIAAGSSLRNGRRLRIATSLSAIADEVVRKALHKGTKKKTSNGGSKDWYDPPNIT